MRARRSCTLLLNSTLKEITTNLSSMHDLKSNFDKFHALTKEFLCDDIYEDGNVQKYSHKPKLSDCEVISLSICMEALSVDSENLLWHKLRTDYSDHFPNLPHRTRFNARRKRLNAWIEKLNRQMATRLSEGEDVFIVDSMPVPICKNARESRLRICKEHFETAPDKGYSAVNKSYFIGYKLHLLTTFTGVYFCMDLSKASVHDLHYLKDVKHSELNNCTLLGDAGYISSEQQTDLFSSSNIKLEVPSRSNQKDYKKYPFIFKKSRKRIETLFSQLCDQMVVKRNYAKTFDGLATRIISKVTAVTALQTINARNGKPLNHIKHALAA